MHKKTLSTIDVILAVMAPVGVTDDGTLDAEIGVADSRGRQPLPSAKIAWNRGRNPPDLIMPTVLRSGPYRAFFYAGDRHEPPHVHVERDRSKAKYWLEPVTLVSSNGFSRGELMDINRLISEQQVVLLQKWHDYFGD